MIDTAAIPPGGEGKVAVTLDTKGKKGNLNKPIQIYTNDPNGSSTIKVKAFIELDFDFERPNLYLGRIAEDSQIVKNVFIQVKDPEKIEITKIASNSPLVSAKPLGFIKEDGKPARFEVEVTAGPGFPSGQFKATIRAFSNLERKPQTGLLVWAQVPTGVEFTPRSLNFRFRPKGISKRDYTKLVKITNFAKDLALEIIEVKDLDDHVQLELKTVEPGQDFELTVTVDPEDIPEAGHYSGRIQVTTNNPEYQELTISYSAVWQE